MKDSVAGAGLIFDPARTAMAIPRGFDLAAVKENVRAQGLPVDQFVIQGHHWSELWRAFLGRSRGRPASTRDSALRFPVNALGYNAF
eukprot:6021281-Pyramimonas_sp.AAC.1